LAAKKITVLAVDDHALLREGIQDILNGAGDMALIGQAGDGDEAVEQYRALRPDVTLMDIQMPGRNGLEALVAIRAISPDARVIMLTAFRGTSQARQSIRLGAAGYLLKSMAQKELCDAIRVVHAGGKYIPARIAAELVAGASDSTLSESEIEVLKLVALGFSNKRIGEALSVPEETVKSRMKGILAKLAANDRTHAVMIALKRGIIDMA
jgi:DNA-binding NarL/FixJ family response regulator